MALLKIDVKIEDMLLYVINALLFLPLCFTAGGHESWNSWKVGWKYWKIDV